MERDPRTCRSRVAERRSLGLWVHRTIRRSPELRLTSAGGSLRGCDAPGRGPRARCPMPLTAFLLARAAAFVHAGWNLLTARAEQSQAATGASLAIGALVFAPVAILTCDVDAAAVPYAIASVALELAYFALLATAYERGPLSVVYPVARGSAPVLVAAVSATALGVALSAMQILGVLVVAVGS